MKIQGYELGDYIGAKYNDRIRGKIVGLSDRPVAWIELDDGSVHAVVLDAAERIPGR